MSKFIVIEGLIGVGKTTLCRLLHDKWNASLVLEPVEDNPFLAQFYSDQERFAFPTQMFYLANRFAQQMGLQQQDLFQDLVVSDYIYAKDRLFAEETLNQDELALYDQFATLLKGGIPKPEFVLFLDAPTDVVIKRIERRAIESEQVIPAEYLNALRDRYYRLWASYDDSPVYIINTTDINSVDNPEAQTLILDIIEGWLNEKPHPQAPEQYDPTRTNQISLL